MYTYSVGIMTQRYDVKYADGTQLYIPLNPGDEYIYLSALENLKHHFADVMDHPKNLVKLNDDKTGACRLERHHSKMRSSS